MRLGLDNLISNIKFLPLLVLGVFLPKECRSSNAF